MNRDLLCENVTVSENGHLQFAGMDTVALAKQYGTPLYLMDEARIRRQCRTYRMAMASAFGDNGQVLYASKAASFKRIYEIMKEEEMGIDVVSIGEMYTAVKAGFPLSRAYFHSNNKTDADIAFAMEHGIGYFVADNAEELRAIDREAAVRSTKQPVLIRITPGIDPHTFAAVATGKVDSKFGAAIVTGQADAMIELALSLPHLRLVGFHCHVGSMVFDADVFLKTADVMLRFIADVSLRYGIAVEQLDLGGGFGVRYLPEHPYMNVAAVIEQVGDFVKQTIAELGIAMPKISIEPGRSMVADAGMTLYTVGSVKKVPGFINYVSVDGGMADNVRYAMYQAPYTLLPADNMLAERELPCSVVGRCCESGDVLQTGVSMPKSIARGDLIAVQTTGAYNYSMASNYNRLPRPPIVMINKGESYVAVRRETIDDLVSLDV